MTDTTEDFESGTATNDIDTASIFTAYSAGSLTYETAAAKEGSLGAQAYSSAGADSNYAFGAVTLSGNDQYFRVYVYLSGLPSSDIEFVACALTSTRRWRARIKSDGTLQLRESNTVVATSSTSMPTGEWVRIEIDAVGTNLTGRFYSGANLEGGTADETVTYSSYTGGTANRLYMGHLSTESSGYTWWFDDVGISDTAQIGPTGSGGPTEKTSADGTEITGTENSSFGTIYLPPEKLLNPGFEVGATTYWQGTGIGFDTSTIAVDTGTVHSGTYSGKVTFPTSSAGKAGIMGNMNSVTTGKKYRFSGWVYVPTGTANVKPDWVFKSGGSYITAKDTWTYFQHDWTSDVTASNIFVGVNNTLGEYSSGQVFYVDDLGVVELIDDETQVTGTDASSTPIVTADISGTDSTLITGADIGTNFAKTASDTTEIMVTESTSGFITAVGSDTTQITGTDGGSLPGAAKVHLIEVSGDVFQQDVSAPYADRTPTTIATPMAKRSKGIAYVINKPYDTTYSTATSGWSKLDECTNGTVASGVDTGSVRVSVFEKTAHTAVQPSLIGPTLVASNQYSPMNYGTVAFGLSDGDTWTLTTSKAGDSDATGTTFSATGDTTLSGVAGDILLAICGFPTDAVAFTSPSLTVAGLTLGTLTEIESGTTTLGDDGGQKVYIAEVLSGTASAAPVLTGTTASGFSSGTVMFVLLHGSGTAPTTEYNFDFDGLTSGSPLPSATDAELGAITTLENVLSTGYSGNAIQVSTTTSSTRTIDIPVSAADTQVYEVLLRYGDNTLDGSSVSILRMYTASGSFNNWVVYTDTATNQLEFREGNNNVLGHLEHALVKYEWYRIAIKHTISTKTLVVRLYAGELLDSDTPLEETTFVYTFDQIANAAPKGWPYMLRFGWFTSTANLNMVVDRIRIGSDWPTPPGVSSPDLETDIYEVGLNPTKTSLAIRDQGYTVSPATIPLPSVAEDQVALLTLVHSHSTPSSVTTPTGWTLEGSLEIVSGKTTYMYSKVLSGAETDVEVTFSPDSGGIFPLIAVYDNVDISNIWDLAPSFSAVAAATTATASSRSTTVDGSMVINLSTTGDNNIPRVVTDADLAGFTVKGVMNGTNGTNGSVTLADKQMSTAGSVTFPTVTQSGFGADEWVLITGALREAGAGPIIKTGTDTTQITGTDVSTNFAKTATDTTQITGTESTSGFITAVGTDSTQITGTDVGSKQVVGGEIPITGTDATEITGTECFDEYVDTYGDSYVCQGSVVEILYSVSGSDTTQITGTDAGIVGSNIGVYGTDYATITGTESRNIVTEDFPPPIIPGTQTDDSWFGFDVESPGSQQAVFDLQNVCVYKEALSAQEIVKTYQLYTGSYAITLSTVGENLSPDTGYIVDEPSNVLSRYIETEGSVIFDHNPVFTSSAWKILSSN